MDTIRARCTSNNLVVSICYHVVQLYVVTELVSKCASFVSRRINKCHLGSLTASFVNKCQIGSCTASFVCVPLVNDVCQMFDLIIKMF